jgi:hypothetical protein
MRKQSHRKPSPQFQMLYQQQILIFKAWLVTLPMLFQRPLILMEQSPLTNGVGVTAQPMTQPLRRHTLTTKQALTQSA